MAAIEISESVSGSSATAPKRSAGTAASTTQATYNRSAGESSVIIAPLLLESLRTGDRRRARDLDARHDRGGVEKRVPLRRVDGARELHRRIGRAGLVDGLANVPADARRGRKLLGRRNDDAGGYPD